MNGTRLTEIYCHNCSRFFSAELDYDLNGNHEITCPNCQHIHYRVIQNGEVTDDRYNTSQPVYTPIYYTGTYSTSFQYTTYTSAAATTISYTWGVI